MSDETWWRDEARRLYADAERLRAERDRACADLEWFIVRCGELSAEVRALTSLDAEEVYKAQLRARIEGLMLQAPAAWVAP